MNDSMLKSTEDFVNIFISYRHTPDDERIMKQLLEFIDTDVQRATGKIWVDKDLETGDFWDEEIRKELERADIAIILVSQSYLGSRYITEVELQSFIERRKRNGLIIMPLILSACRWKQHDWLAKTQFLPSGDETIEENYTESGKRKRLFAKFTDSLIKRIDFVKQNKRKVVNTLQPLKQVEDSKSMKGTKAETQKRVFIISDSADKLNVITKLISDQSPKIQIVSDNMQSADNLLYLLNNEVEPNYPTLEDILKHSKPVTVVRMDDARLSRHSLDEKSALLTAEIYAKLRLSDSRQLVCLTLGCDSKGQVVTGFQNLIETLLDDITL